jgi:hypothetical protein
MTPIERGSEMAELRAEFAALHARLARIEALVRFVYGDSALGGAGPAPLPPAEPARTMRPIATIGFNFRGAPR